MKQPRPLRLALIGPEAVLSRAVAHLMHWTSALPRPGFQCVALAVTEGEAAPLKGLGVPTFESWRELVRKVPVQTLVNMSSHPACKNEVRQALPSEIELTEVTSLRSLYALYVAGQDNLIKYKTQKQLLKDLLNTLTTAAILYDVHGRVRAWNKACESLTGIPSQEIIGRKEVGSAFYIMDRPLLGQLVLRDISKDSLRKYYDENVVINAIPGGYRLDGNIQGLKPEIKGHYQILARRVEVRGRTVGAVELIKDLNPVISLRKQSDQHQNQLRAIMSHIPFPIVQTSLDGTILVANAEAHEVLYPLLNKDRHLRGENFLHLAPEFGERFEAGLRSKSFDPFSAAQESVSSTFKTLWNDVAWEVTYFLVSEDNESWTVIWILYNLTGKEEKSRINAALAVAGAISHELSQPLTAIVNSAQLLVGTPPENQERLDRHKNIIARESERVFDLHRKLQNISKYKLKDYMDTHIFDLDESSELSLTIPEKPEEE